MQYPILEEIPEDYFTLPKRLKDSPVGRDDTVPLKFSCLIQEKVARRSGTKMSRGIDKLVLLSDEIEKRLSQFSPRAGFRAGRLSLCHRSTSDPLQLPPRRALLRRPAQWQAQGRSRRRCRVRARKNTKEILRTILGHLSAARIYRIDLCTDILGLRVWDLTEVVLISRSQNFKIYNNRGGATFYLSTSTHKTILLYDKVKQLAAKCDQQADTFSPGESLTRIEVQLKDRGVPFKKIRHLHRYADVDLLGQLHFRRLKRLRDDAKPLHLLAAGGLRRLDSQNLDLHAVKKQIFAVELGLYRKRPCFEFWKERKSPNLRLSIETQHRGLVGGPDSISAISWCG